MVPQLRPPMCSRPSTSPRPSRRRLVSRRGLHFRPWQASLSLAIGGPATNSLCMPEKRKCASLLRLVTERCRSGFFLHVAVSSMIHPGLSISLCASASRFSSGSPSFFLVLKWRLAILKLLREAHLSQEIDSHRSNHELIDASDVLLCRQRPAMGGPAPQIRDLLADSFHIDAPRLEAQVPEKVLVPLFLAPVG